MALYQDPSTRLAVSLLRERVLFAFTLGHTGHPGIPGARDDSCPRCNSERALEQLLDIAIAAKAVAARRHDGVRVVSNYQERIPVDKLELLREHLQLAGIEVQQ